MAKQNFTPVVGADNIGKAVAKQGQITALSFSGLNYIVDGVYVAPVQYAHAVNMTINGQNRTVTRIFVIEYAQGPDGTYHSTGNVTAINVNALLGTNFGEVTDQPAPVIDAEQKDGLWRAVRKSGIYKRTLVGTTGLSVDTDNSLKVSTPIAYVNRGSKQVYVADIIETPEGKYNFKVIEDGDAATLDLATQNAMFWESKSPISLGIEEPATLEECLPKEFPNRDALCVK